MDRVIPRHRMESHWIRFLRGLVVRWRARPPVRRDPRHFRVAIVKLDRLGDGVLAVGAIRTVLRHYGESQSLLVISPQAEALMAAEFPETPRLVLPVAVMHRRIFAQGAVYRAAVARFTCDDVICLRHQREDWDELVMAWLDGRQTWAMEPAPESRDFTPVRTYVCPNARRPVESRQPARAAGICHELERHRQLLSVVLGRQVEGGDILPQLQATRPDAAGGDVLFTPFSAMPIRDFPPDLLMAALAGVRLLTAASIRLYGTRAQGPELERLAAAAGGAGIADVTVAASDSTQSYMQAVASARLVVTVDTATAHLATALDRPAVILMGGGHPDEFVPWGLAKRQVWLTHEIDCFGCDWQCRHPAPYCLTRIPAKAVVEAIKMVWGGDRAT